MTNVRTTIRSGGLLAAGGLMLAAGLVTSESLASSGPTTSSVGSVLDVRSEPASTARTAPKVPSISGSGRIYFDDEQERYFTFDASGLAVEGYPDEGVPGTTGSFAVAHFNDKSHRNGVRFWGHVDCLVVGGRTATFTGVIDRAIAFGEGVPDVSALDGVRRGFSVYDSRSGRPDRLGFSWFMDPGSLRSTPKCQGPAPFSYLDKGGYETSEWLPPELVPPGR